jgi:hypothetical protein
VHGVVAGEGVGAGVAPGNALTGIDIRTGTPRRNGAKSLRGNTPVRDICPAAPGATIGAPAYSEPLGLLFIPVSFLCMDLRALPVSYMTRRLKPMPDHPRGALVAWDFKNAKPAWSIPETPARRRRPRDGGRSWCSCGRQEIGSTYRRATWLRTMMPHRVTQPDSKVPQFCCDHRAGPMVRIHFPPAVSLVRAGFPGSWLAPTRGLVQGYRAL